MIDNNRGSQKVRVTLKCRPSLGKQAQVSRGESRLTKLARGNCAFSTIAVDNIVSSV
jgi:hypothetical protein